MAERSHQLGTSLSIRRCAAPGAVYAVDSRAPLPEPRWRHNSPRHGSICIPWGNLVAKASDRSRSRFDFHLQKGASEGALRLTHLQARSMTAPTARASNRERKSEVCNLK